MPITAIALLDYQTWRAPDFWRPSQLLVLARAGARPDDALSASFQETPQGDAGDVTPSLPA